MTAWNGVGSARPPGRITLALTAACLLLVGCSSAEPDGSTAKPQTWEAVAAAAQDESAVTVYSAGTPEQNRALETAFEKRYPEIAVTMVRLASQQLTQRADAEQAGGAEGADVVIHTNVNWFDTRADRSGYFAPLRGPNLSEAKLEDLLSDDGLTVVPSAGVYGFAWNTKSIKGDLSLPELVKNDKLKQRIGVYDFGQNDVFALLFKHYEEEYGEQFLHDLAALEPRYYPSTVPMAQALGAGQISVALPMVETAAAGLPVEVAYAERPFAVPFRAAVTGWATHPNAAQLLVNFLMSSQGQEAWAADSVSALPNVESALFDASEVKLADVTAFNKQFYKKYVAKLNKIFDR